MSDGLNHAPAKGGRIEGLAEAQAEGATILQAGTATDAEGRLIAAGGRVLGVVGTGATVAESGARAYAAIKRISYADGFCRADIAWREIARERASN